MAKRRRRKRKFTARLFLILALVLIAAGFITRRVLLPTAWRNYQPDSASRADAPRNPTSADNTQPAQDNLNDRDRQELDTLIRSKTR